VQAALSIRCDNGQELMSRKIAAWRKEYNQKRPYSSLGYRTPKEFATAADSTQFGGNAGPLLQTNIPAQTGDGTERVCRIFQLNESGQQVTITLLVEAI
jgi:hypothetical protein